MIGYYTPSQFGYLLTWSFTGSLHSPSHYLILYSALTPRERSDFSFSASPFTQIAGGKPRCGRAAPCSGQRCIETKSCSGIGEFSQDLQLCRLLILVQNLVFGADHMQTFGHRISSPATAKLQMFDSRCLFSLCPLLYYRF